MICFPPSDREGGSTLLLEPKKGCYLRDIPIFLTEREVKRLNAGAKELDLKSPVSYLTSLSDELLETRLSDLAGAVRGGIGPIIVAGRRRVQCHSNRDFRFAS